MARLATATIVAGAFFALATCATEARAAPRQPRDYFLNPPQRGMWLHADAYTIGTQGTAELRIPIEDETTGMVHLRANALASLGYGEVGAHADARFMFLTLGASVGHRRVWRNYTGDEGREVTRVERDRFDRDGLVNAEVFSVYEARARLSVPLESLFFITQHTVRQENGPANSYDWFHANTHDGGLMYKAEAMLFARHPRFGGFGPLVRFMDLPRRGARAQELAAGFVLATRPGFFKRDDNFVLSMLVRPGDQEFGFSFLKLPMWAFAAYRVSFRVW